MDAYIVARENSVVKTAANDIAAAAGLDLVCNAVFKSEAVIMRHNGAVVSVVGANMPERTDVGDELPVNLVTGDMASWLKR